MLQSSLWCQHKKSSRTDHKPKIFVTHKRKELYEQTQQIPQLVFRQHRLRAGCGTRFRRTRKYLANSLNLVGWVQNEWDGTVTMEVQGREWLINELLKGLNRNQFITIEWMDTEEIPLEDEKKFWVRDGYM